MSAPPEDLGKLVAASLARPLVPQVLQLGEEIRRRHGPGVAAVLAYGSCLRDTAPTDSLIDYYVLCDTGRCVSPRLLSRLLCRLVPPNVYYCEARMAGTSYRAKYAVLTLARFRTCVSRATGNPYFWARFAQPAAAVYCRNDDTRKQVNAAVSDAIDTMLANVAPPGSGNADAIEIWTAGLQQTYATELRAEGPDRARRIVDADEDYYRRAWSAWLSAGRQPVRTNWRYRRLQGKVLSVLRLAKAAFTFTGGADYLAWKITRHSGKEVALTDWQRRHPILAAMILLPRLLKSGAVR